MYTVYVVSAVIFFARTSEVFNDQFMTSNPASVCLEMQGEV